MIWKQVSKETWAPYWEDEFGEAQGSPEAIFKSMESEGCSGGEGKALTSNVMEETSRRWMRLIPRLGRDDIEGFSSRNYFR
jgi:hypothetical protein